MAGKGKSTSKARGGGYARALAHHVRRTGGVLGRSSAAVG